MRSCHIANICAKHSSRQLNSTGEVTQLWDTPADRMQPSAYSETYTLLLYQDMQRRKLACIHHVGGLI